MLQVNIIILDQKGNMTPTLTGNGKSTGDVISGLRRHITPEICNGYQWWVKNRDQLMNSSRSG